MNKRLISKHANNVRHSGIRKIFNITNTMNDVVNFGIGEPDFPTPDHIIEAAKKAMADGYTHYTDNAGFLDFREIISEKLKTENNIAADPKEEVLVTCGGMGGLYLALRTIIDTGDEVLVPEPAWVNYAAQISLAGGTMTTVPLKKETGFTITADLIAEYVTENTKVLLLNTPCNPTGKIIPEKELQSIALLAEKQGLIIICDEVYEKFVWDGYKHVSIASFPEAAGRTVTVNSLSKSYAMTGWRVGFAAGNKEIIANMTKLQENIYACPSSISQKAAAAALQTRPEDLGEMLLEYANRRDVMLRELSAIEKIHCVPTEGSFYMFTDISATGMCSEDFAMNLLQEEKVALVPGSAFGKTGEGFVRISFASAIDKIEEGVSRIKQFLFKHE